MIIANLNKMAKNGLGVEYEQSDHRWVNQQISCGCTIAICTSVTPSKEDVDGITPLFTKNNTLMSLINETMNSDDEEIKRKFDQFSKELEDTRLKMKRFIDEKRTEYKFPISTDFNSEYYYIKLKHGANCKS